MTLLDEIIDTAEELATERILPPSATPQEVVTALSQVIRVPLAFNSTGAKLGIAAFNRYATMVAVL